MIKLRRKILFSGVLGILSGFCYVAGYYLDNYDSLDLLSGRFYLFWVLGSFLGALCVFGVFKVTEYVSEKADERLAHNDKNVEECKRKFRIPYWLCVVVLIICWLPAYLSIFPGAFNYDALAEWEQVVQGNITSHHPVLHVVVLGGLVEGFYALTGSYNVGIAVYTILQMAVLANVFALVIRFLAEFRLPAFFQVFTLAFFGLSPVIQLFSISVTKDTLFAAAELLFFLYVIRFYCRREDFFSGRKHLLGFGIVAFFTMILRNNGLYIVLLTLIAMAVPCVRNRKRYGKKFLMVLLGILLLYGAYVGPVYSVLDVKAGGVEEMLSVPIQQMARVHKYDYASLEQEDLDLLYKVLPKENLDAYKATVSDFVKKGFDREGFEENKVELVKLWVNWLVEHPLTYMNSFLINTVDFWYPNAVIDGYRDPYGKSSFFDYQVDEPGTEVVLLKGAHNYYETLSHDREAQKQPLAFLLLSPGWYLLLSVIVFGYLWCYKKYKFMVPMLILVWSILTVLLGPMALVRYVLIFYYVFPVLLAIMFAGSYFEKKEN